MDHEQYERIIDRLIDYKNEKLLLPDEAYLKLDYSKEFVEYAYHERLAHSESRASKLAKIDNANYLENYLLPFYSHLRAKESHALTNSILLLINHKFQENVNFWEYFNTTDLRDKFKALFEHLASMHLSELNYSEKIEFLMFLINTFRCYEEDFISEICLKYVGYPLWKNLSTTFLKSLFLKYPNLLRAYKKHVLNKTFEHRQTEFMIECINHFWVCMGEIKKGTMEVENGDGQHQIYSDEQVKYFEKFIELCIDLLSQVPTRSHFRFLLLDQNFVVKCKLTQLYHSEQGSLFKKLIEMLQASQDYPLHEENGTVMTDSMITLLHYDKMAEFQNVLFKNFKERFASSLVKNVSNIDSRKSLIEILDYLSDEEVVLICQKLNIPLPPPEFFENSSFFRADLSYLDLVIEILLDHLIKKKRTIDIANNTPHYPTEKLLWDKNLIPEDMYFGRKTLPLPKLNLQFLSIEDYLIRNYNLFRLEASYEIKANIEDSITRVHANFDKTGNFSSFNGWARMATEVKEFSVHEVQPPKIGDIYPSNVFAELRYSVQNMKMAFKKEWEQLKKHDVIFLVSFKKNLALWENKDEEDMNFLEKYSIQYIRGAEVISQLDEDRNEIGNQDFNERSSNPEGNSRFLQVQLDPVQYKIDLETLGEKDNEVYGSFHLVIRRKAKENNFKAILSTIKELINSNLTIPDWLEDVLLGYGSLKSEEYIEFRNKNFNPKSVNYFDTFLDKRHYEETFSNNSNIPAHDKEVPTPSALIQKSAKSSEKPWLYDWKIDFNLPYYAEEFRKIDIQRRKNAIRFTSKQVEAIYSGVNEGLTLIEGPPGTGKTDVAVQIISLIYHNYPNERTLLITHSNHALNDLFEKITKLDINERYLLRLGMGEKELETSQDFSRYGRVNYMLERRIILLNEVQKLSQSLVVNIYPEFTCETAEILYKYHIESRWQEYEELVLHAHKKTEKASASNKEIALKFPFLRYLKICRFLTRSGNMDDEDGRSVEEIPEEDLAKQFFDFKDVEGDIERANFYWQIIHNMFKELEECRAFEILRSNRERSNYLVSKQAKIIAMTCTHAALKRVDLIESGFEYDNVLIEEAGQILEVESFIPLVLQKPRFGKTSRLKRFILIGDHNQLPPIIKNNAFQKFSQMEQSMFTRLVRLKIPYDCLSHQGRMRPSLLKLFGWRYPYLDNLPAVVSNPESSNPTEYDFENAGFAHEYQFIDVPDFNGKGESSPMPYFYQNLAEAEYVVATYMYMVLNGYPPEKISILTTYNGQKFLIRDIIHQKCSWNPIFGKPAKITTVDKYQGQQNDYILLSLVRTEHVGHLRDPRRLTVAMSRARLGLFIFGRFELFSGCHELRNTFKTLMSKPLKLQIVPQETYPSQRRAGDPKQNVSGQPIEDFQHLYKVVQSKLQEMSTGAKSQQSKAKFGYKDDLFDNLRSKLSQREEH